MLLKSEIRGTLFHTKASADYLVYIVLRYFVVSICFYALSEIYNKKNIDFQFLSHLLEFKLHKSIFLHPVAVYGKAAGNLWLFS